MNSAFPCLCQREHKSASRLTHASVEDAASRLRSTTLHDPTGTHILRQKFRADLDKRWERVRRLTAQALAGGADTAFGLEPSVVSVATSLASGNRVQAFQQWLDEALRQIVLGYTGTWTEPYIAEAMAMAKARARRLTGVMADAGPLTTLYVRRDILNAPEIIAWAKDHGFATTLQPGDLHVTVTFSRRAVDWRKFGRPDEQGIVAAGGPRHLHAFGDDKDAIVLAFDCERLSARHEWMMARGASWDHPQYQPHVTITWNVGDFDWQNVEPYAGPIILGPEVYESVKEDWKEKITEDSAALPDREQALLQLTASELDGICAAASQQATRVMTHGLLANAKPKLLARAVAQRLTKIGKQRSRMLANAMVVKAFSSATLQAFRQAAVTQVGTLPERNKIKVAKGPHGLHMIDRTAMTGGIDVLTAGDDDVCIRCEEASDDGPYSLDEAESLLPIHPNCRCAFVPVDDERFASVHEGDE